jgi:hypothetical protein
MPIVLYCMHRRGERACCNPHTLPQAHTWSNTLELPNYWDGRPCSGRIMQGRRRRRNRRNGIAEGEAADGCGRLCGVWPGRALKRWLACGWAMPCYARGGDGGSGGRARAQPAKPTLCYVLPHISWCVSQIQLYLLRREEKRREQKKREEKKRKPVPTNRAGQIRSDYNGWHMSYD